MLLVQGADPNAQDDRGLTALVACAINAVCSEGALGMLLHAGADVNARESAKGITPLIAASISRSEGKVRRLLRMSARTDAKDEDGNTAADQSPDSGPVRDMLQEYDKDPAAWREQARARALRVQTNHDADINRHIAKMKTTQRQRDARDEL